MQRLFQVVAEKDLANQKQVRDYTYIARQVQNKLDGKGQTKSTEVKTYEVLEIYGEQVQRLIAKDDKPLEGKDDLARVMVDGIGKYLDRATAASPTL